MEYIPAEMSRYPLYWDNQDSMAMIKSGQSNSEDIDVSCYRSKFCAVFLLKYNWGETTRGRKWFGAKRPGVNVRKHDDYTNSIKNGCALEIRSFLNMSKFSAYVDFI